ncbi:MAG: hypothetical protein ACJ72D_02320 [Marmoricola sp.]
MTGGWDLGDAWVFAAIGSRRQPCTLADVIAAGDRLNHAILTEDELETALGRLAGAGLVRVFDDWTFELTDDGSSLWTSDDRDATTRLPLLQAELAVFEPGRVVVRLPRGVRDEAVAAYQER